MHEALPVNGLSYNINSTSSSCPSKYQLSSINTLQGHWQRLPVLLLAEGDIIALMGGDITPGACYELERLQQQQLSGQQQEQLSGQQQEQQLSGQQQQEQLSGQQQQEQQYYDGPKASLDSCSNRDTATMTMPHPDTVNSTNIAATANANLDHINNGINSIATKTTTIINNSSSTASTGPDSLGKQHRDG